MSDEHFTVDGTLIQAWASQESFRPKDGSDGSGGGDGTNFHGQTRSNETHESTTDPDARLYKKSYGKESHLAYLGHALLENRNGLIAAATFTRADGFAEREAALMMLADKQEGRTTRITVGADKADDDRQFVAAALKLNVTPHVSKNDKGRRSNMDARTTRHECYAISLSCRWLVEKSFGWLKQTGPVRQVKVRGLHKVNRGLRLQLRGAQTAAAARADREATNRRSRAAVRLNEERDRNGLFYQLSRFGKHPPTNRFERKSTSTSSENPATAHRLRVLQQAPKAGTPF